MTTLASVSALAVAGLVQQTIITLQESQEKLAVTLNSIGDAVIATDAEARVRLMNPVAEQLTGWTLADAAGHAVDEVFHIINQETRQPAVTPVMETLTQGTVQGLANHTLLIARDGSERAIADSCAPMRDPDGRVVGAVLVFRDVTEDYAVQRSLRDSSALIQTVLNTVVDGIITIQARVNNKFNQLIMHTRKTCESSSEANGSWVTSFDSLAPWLHINSIFNREMYNYRMSCNIARALFHRRNFFPFIMALYLRVSCTYHGFGCSSAETFSLPPSSSPLRSE